MAIHCLRIVSGHLEIMTWWTLEPPDVTKIKKQPAHEQVIEQIRSIYRTIDNDLLSSNVKPMRRYDLNYEEFCSNPKSEIEKIRSFLRCNGHNIEFRGTPPDSFKRRQTININKSIYAAMEEYANYT